MDTKLIWDTVQYVTKANLFWASMGFTTAIAMFIGAILYNGELSQVKKGLASVGSYAVLLIWTTIVRVLGVFDDPVKGALQRQFPQMAFAGILTIILISFFWILGIYLGVIILSIRNKKK